MDLNTLYNLIRASRGFAFDFECVDSEGRPTRNPLAARPVLISFATGKPVVAVSYAWDAEKGRFLGHLLRTKGLLAVTHYGYYDFFVAYFNGCIDLHKAEATLSDSRMIWWMVNEEDDLRLKKLVEKHLSYKMKTFRGVQESSFTTKIKEMQKTIAGLPKEANKQLAEKKKELKAEGKAKAELPALLEWYTAQAEATIRNETDRLNSEIGKLELLARQEFMAYSADDSKQTWRLYWAGIAELRRMGMLDKLDIMHENYRQSILMTATGFTLDLVRAEAIRKEAKAILDDIEAEVYGIAKQEFNLNSAIQIARVLYHDLGIAPPPDTPRLSYKQVANEPWAYSTDSDTLKLITHPIAQKILDFRAADTVYANFIVGLPEQAAHDPYHKNRVRVVLNSSGTVTGRYSSSAWESASASEEK